MVGEVGEVYKRTQERGVKNKSRGQRGRFLCQILFADDTVLKNFDAF